MLLLLLLGAETVLCHGDYNSRNSNSSSSSSRSLGRPPVRPLVAGTCLDRWLPVACLMPVRFLLLVTERIVDFFIVFAVVHACMLISSLLGRLVTSACFVDEPDGSSGYVTRRILSRSSSEGRSQMSQWRNAAPPLSFSD